MEKRIRSFDICIICALYEEAEAVLNEFSTRCNVSFSKKFSGMDHYAYQHTTIWNKRGEPLTILVTWLSDSGPTQTGLDLKPFLHEFHPRFVAMTGICAGYKRKVKLGDLVVAQYAYSYEEGKITKETEGSSLHQLEMKTADPTSQVIQYAKGFENWKEPVREMKRKKLNRQLKANEEPRCIVAPMASGMAVRGDDPFPWLREKYNRNTVALDMEAATFYRAFRAVPHIHALVVKGVCDYADMDKNDAYHDYAARASAVYLLTFIQEYVTEQTMPQRNLLPPSNRAGPPVWNVPHSRNPHFTGRDKLLDQLAQQLLPKTQNHTMTTRRAALTQPQAIKGLGGIGKTQIAVEYAYRSRDQGHYTHTLWINAVSKETIITSFVTIAELLPGFPAQSETDQRKLVDAVKRWLEQCEQRWLLIFDNVDNADDLPLIQEYLPQRGNGSVLLTTRANAVGSLAAPLEVEKMGLMEGVQFLLHRAQRKDHISDEEVNEATNIVIALDHFPLALDQAGAYIEETRCRFVDYLQIYQNHRQALLARRGLQGAHYPDSVATTWSLSFQKVEQANPAAAELLRLCAFLAPDKIPEELIRDGAAQWTPPLQQAAADLLTFNQMVEELLKFSLVERLAETQTLGIHRLVQAVQIDTMELEMQRRWAARVIQAVNKVFPKKPQDTATWPQCLRYLGQAQVCNTLIEQYKLPLIDAARLLNRTGFYLEKQALYTVAEPLYQRALAICEQRLGATHPNTATNLSNLAALYAIQGRYREAEPLYQRALAIDEQHFGAVHPHTAASLNNLAALYDDQGRYREAESLYQRALAICEQQLGAMHPNTAHSLNNLAFLYSNKGRYKEAEVLYQRALAIYKQELGVHPSTAQGLNNLADLYYRQGKDEEAEPLFQQALTIREQVLGEAHPDTAQSIWRLAVISQRKQHYQEAKSLYQRAFSIYKQTLGEGHPRTQSLRRDYISLLRTMGDEEEGKRL